MDELQTLQSRVDAILRVPHSRPPAHTAQAFTEKVAATPPTSFSPFDPAQAQQANMLARRFVRLANSTEGTAGLQAVLDEAEKATVTPSEALLNWFREDPKANEHHEHWHLVYPFNGDPVTGMTRDRQSELFLYMHEQMIAAQKNMAARDITIRLVDAVPG